jgi:uncharacterized protein (TIGR00730 family)
MAERGAQRHVERSAEGRAERGGEGRGEGRAEHRVERRNVVVFGSSRITPDSEDYRLAYAVGRAVAERCLGLVSGGYEGAMGAASRGASSAGGAVVGITTSIFGDREPNSFLSEHRVEPDYLARMRSMVRHGDAFVALPGGLGTLSELTTAWCLATIGQVRGPIWVFEHPWRPLAEAIQELPEVGDGFIAHLNWVADVTALERELDRWVATPA